MTIIILKAFQLTESLKLQTNCFRNFLNYKLYVLEIIFTLTLFQNVDFVF